MATINVTEDLLAELREKAAAEGKSVDELASEALRKGLDERAWQDLLEYGRQTGRASGHAEEDLPRLVEEWRRERRR